MGVEKNRPVFSFFLLFPRLPVSLGVLSLLFLKLLGLGGDCVQRQPLCPFSQPGSGSRLCMTFWTLLASFCVTDMTSLGAWCRPGKQQSKGASRQEVLMLGSDGPCSAIRESRPLSKDLMSCAPHCLSGTRSVMHVI